MSFSSGSYIAREAYLALEPFIPEDDRQEAKKAIIKAFLVSCDMYLGDFQHDPLEDVAETMRPRSP